MSRKPLWEVSVATSAEAEEAVVNLLEKVLARTATVYVDEEAKAPVVSVFVERVSEWTPTRRQVLVSGLEALCKNGLDIGAGRISFRKLPAEDWAESWKRHFKPIEIGSALLIKPSWSRRRPRRGQSVVVLDPGLSFGTGQHPTTAFCLRQLVACRRHGWRQGFLDIGTGSGILAIAAAKLGYTPVDAFDFDAEAVSVARANAARNRVQHRLRIRQQNLGKLPVRGRRRYDLICANLTADLLLSARERILNRLRAGGSLVLAGILRGEFKRVRRAYEQSGLRLAVGDSRHEWRCGQFVLEG